MTTERYEVTSFDGLRFRSGGVEVARRSCSYTVAWAATRRWNRFAGISTGE